MIISSLIEILYLDAIVSKFLDYSSSLLEKLPKLAYHIITIEFMSLYDISIEMIEFTDKIVDSKMINCNNEDIMNIFEEFRQSIKSKLADIKNIYIEEDIDIKVPELKEEFNLLIKKINSLDFTSRKGVKAINLKPSNNKKF